jgi:hypothetical protein
MLLCLLPYVCKTINICGKNSSLTNVAFGLPEEGSHEKGKKAPIWLVDFARTNTCGSDLYTADIFVTQP